MIEPAAPGKDTRVTRPSLWCRGREYVWGSRTYVMGIINVTPDSFSGDGLGYDVAAAVQQARRFVAEGADFIDVGGESTRPGHLPIPVEEEVRRVVPVIEAVVQAVAAPVSIDTYKAPVAKAAFAAGAHILNDIWGLRRDPAMAAAAAAAGAPVILMHNQDGTGYDDLIPDVKRALSESIRLAVAAGIPRERIILDPGIGFGKTWEHNLVVLRRLREFEELGCPLLVGASRKSFIGRILNLPVEERTEGTAASCALAIANGADIIRVHDVREMVRVARVADAIVRGADRPHSPPTPSLSPYREQEGAK